MIFSLQTEGAPILSQVSDAWDFSDPPHDPREVEAELTRLMLEEGGVGFAANQMGLASQVFAMNIGGETTFHYNPSIVENGETMVLVEEGCLSFPGLNLKVKRPRDVLVTYQDGTGVSHTEWLTGLASRCFQHELDHLQGRCFTDRVSKLSLDMARKRRAKNERKK